MGRISPVRQQKECVNEKEVVEFCDLWTRLAEKQLVGSKDGRRIRLVGRGIEVLSSGD
jgi:uncharacterized protein YjhX (UPF0386 family)